MKKFVFIIRNFKNEQGQGIVEFAIILAFCAAIGYAVNNSGVFTELKNILTNTVVFALDDTRDGNDIANNAGQGQQSSGDDNSSNNGTSNNGTSNNGTSNNGTSNNGNTGVAGVGASGFDWGAKDPTKYYKQAYNGDDGYSFTQVDSQDDRLAADQKTLENLATFFLGKTQNDIISLLKGKDDGKDYTADMASNQEVLLGHFVPYDETTKTGMRFKTDKGYLNKSESENIFAWMQGIYTDIAEDKNTVVENANYNHDRLYLVSDYIVSQTWADRSGSYQENGVRIKFEYDYSGSYIYPGSYETQGAVKVVGVQLSIDPRSQHNTEVGTSQFNEQHSNGLEVHIRRIKDENGQDKDVVTFKDTGLATTSGNNGMTNWYGNDVTAATLKTYIESNRFDYSSGITKEFERGEIFKFQGKYYIATKKETVTIKSSDTQAILEAGIFIKFTGVFPGRYYLENAKAQFDGANHCYKKIIIPEHGSLMILSTGEAYIYVGNEKNMPYTGITDDFIKIR